MRRIHLAFLLVPLLLIAASPVQAEGQLQIAVMELRADTTLDEGTARTLNEILLAEFSAFKELEVLGSSDIVSMLKHDEQKSMLAGCSDDSCLAELGGALGVGVIAVPSLGAVGSQYVVNVKLIDVAQVKVLARVSETVDRSDDELISAFKRAVQNAVEKTLAKRNIARVPEPVPTAEPSSALRVAPWVTLGLTGLAAVTGGVLGLLALDAADTASEEETDPVQWNDHKEKAEGLALGADVCFGIAGAAAVTTLVLFLVRPDEPEPETRVEVTPAFAPTSGGAAAGLTVRF